MQKNLLLVNSLIVVGIVIVVLSFILTPTPELPSPESESGFPPYVPAMIIPVSNPQTPNKIRLGRHLFYEPRLSVNGTQSCSSCHIQELAFSDGRRHSPGATGELTRRNAMSLTNVGFNASLTWAEPALQTLEQQALVPLTSQHPIEMGFHLQQEQIIESLQQDRIYRDLFVAAFPNQENPVSRRNIVAALASFQRSLVSFDSPYDRFLQGDANALNDAAKSGLALFFSEKMHCFRCHGGFNFRFTPGHRVELSDQSVAFHNTGLYNLNGLGAYPTEDRGLMEVTGSPDDMGKFKAPTLRNIALTAPYMHDGSIESLEQVIDHYASGGRKITGGHHAGDGSRSPLKSPLVNGFTISETEKRQLLAFLASLTDNRFIADPRHADPHAGQPNRED